MKQAHVPIQPPNPGKDKGNSGVGSLTTIYIRRIPDTMDEDMLHDDFKRFGRVMATKVYRYGQTRGPRPASGFVEFESPSVASYVLNSINECGNYKGINTHALWAKRSLSESLSRVRTHRVGTGKLYDHSTPTSNGGTLPKSPVMREAQLWYKHVQNFYMQQERAQNSAQMYNPMYAPIAYAPPARVIYVHHPLHETLHYYPYPVM